jgi:multiple antibiotic resistance protein
LNNNQRPDFLCDRAVSHGLERETNTPKITKSKSGELDAKDFRRAFYPLTLPLTVGSGSISVAVTIGANAARSHSFHPLTILAALLGLALIALSIL